MKSIAFLVVLLFLASCGDTGGYQRGYVISHSVVEESVESPIPAQE